MSCNLLILEEAAYIDPDVIKDVMAPVVNVNNTAIVAISTPGKKPTAMFNKMTKNEFFFTHRVMFICEPCLAQGVRDPCKHNRDFVPGHLGENSDLVKSLFGDDDEKRNREVMGIMEEGGANCFRAHFVDRLFSRPRITVHDPARYVYVVADPSAGSKLAVKNASDFCLVTYCGPTATVIGIEAIDALRTEDYQERVLEHLRRIRRMEAFSRSVFVVDAEAGTGYTAGDIEQLIMRNFDDVVLMSDLGRKPGTFTSAPAKREMVEIATALIESDEVRILDQFVCTDPNPRGVLDKFRTQMQLYERVVVAGKTLQSNNSVMFTGKQHGPDDIIQTFLRACRARQKFLFDAKYAHLRR